MKKKILFCLWVCLLCIMVGCRRQTASCQCQDQCQCQCQRQQNADDDEQPQTTKEKPVPPAALPPDDGDEHEELPQAESYAAGSTLEMPAPLTDRPEKVLRRKGYMVSYNEQTKIANWVAWRLTDRHTSGPYKRKGVPFQEDEEVAQPRATTYDYQQKRYDRGHMCPAGDNRWDAQAMSDCFLLTNICPQNHNLNGGDWNDLEIKCRSWAEKYGEVYIVTGPILYDGQHETIGKNKITVPDAFFKVVLVTKGSGKALGFIYPNQAGHRSMADYACSVDEVERVTGIDFFHELDDDIEDRVEQQATIKGW